MQKVRNDVFKRDGFQCVATETTFGLRCSTDLSVQHRVKRGMGSSSRYDAPNYLLAMCGLHNSMDASDAVFRTFSIRYGWSAPRWVAERELMSRVPVFYGYGWFLLDGLERFRIPERVALDLMGEIYGRASFGAGS